MHLCLKCRERRRRARGRGRGEGGGGCMSVRAMRSSRKEVTMKTEE